MSKAYVQEKEGKERVREELIALAGQVRLMEKTYKKELIQN